MKPLLVRNKGGHPTFLSLFFSLSPFMSSCCSIPAFLLLVTFCHPLVASFFFISLLILLLTFQHHHLLFFHFLFVHLILPFITSFFLHPLPCPSVLIFSFPPILVFIFRDTDCSVTSRETHRMKSRKRYLIFYLFDFILCNSALPFFFSSQQLNRLIFMDKLSTSVEMSNTFFFW